MDDIATIVAVLFETEELLYAWDPSRYSLQLNVVYTLSVAVKLNVTVLDVLLYPGTGEFNEMMGTKKSTVKFLADELPWLYPSLHVTFQEYIPLENADVNVVAVLFDVDVLLWFKTPFIHSVQLVVFLLSVVVKVKLTEDKLVM